MKSVRRAELSAVTILVCAVFGVQEGLSQAGVVPPGSAPSREAVRAELKLARSAAERGELTAARQRYLTVLAQVTPPAAQWQQSMRRQVLREMFMGRKWLDDALAAYAEHPDYDLLLSLGEQLKRQGRGFEMLGLYRDYLLVGPVEQEQDSALRSFQDHDFESLAERVIDEIISVGEGESTAQRLRLASTEQPGEARLHRNLGHLLLRTAECDEALVEFDAYLATKDRVLATDYLRLGDVCQRAGLVERAIEFYEKSLETELTREDSVRPQIAAPIRPRDEAFRGPVLRSLGNLYVRQGRLADAEACFKRLADFSTSYYREDGKARLATLWDQMGKENAILNDLENRVRADPDNASLRAEYAAALLKAKRPGEAAAQYGQARALAPDDLSLRLRLAAALAANNQPETALPEYLETLAAASRKDPNEFRRGKAGDETEPGRVLNTLIRFCENLDDRDERLECLLKVLELLDSADTPWQGEPYSWSTILRSMTDIYASRGEHETLVQLLLDHRHKTDRAGWLLAQLPWRHFDSLDPIVKRLSDETASDPNDLWGRMILGDVLIEQNRRAEAIEIYRRLLEDAPGSSSVLTALCERLELFDRDDLLLKAYAKELAALKEGSTDYARKLGQIGGLHLRLGRKAEAAKYYREAISRDPTGEQYWRGLSQATDGREGANALIATPAEDLDVLRSQAQALLAGRQDPAEAAARLEHVLQKAPTDVKSMVLLGQAYEQLARRDEALALYEQAYRMRQWSNGQIYDVDHHLKRLYGEIGSDDKLISLLTEQHNYSEVSRIYQSQGHPEKYESYLLDQIVAQPTTDLRFYLAEYYLDNGNTDAAAPLGEQLRAELVDHSGVISNSSTGMRLARVFERLGRIDEALAIATSLDYENDPDSNDWLGQLLTRLYAKAGPIENALDTCLLRLKKDAQGYRTTDIAEEAVEVLPNDAGASQRLAAFLDKVEAEISSRQYGRFRGAVLAYADTHRPVLRGALQGPSDPVALLKRGRQVHVPQNCRSFANFLERLAAQAGTVAIGSFMGRYGESIRAPRVRLTKGAAYEILAAALDGRNIPMQLDQNGYWEINESADKSRKYTYAGSGGMLWMLDGLTCRDDGTDLRLHGTIAFDPGLAADVVAMRSTFALTKATDSRGHRVELPGLTNVVHGPTQFALALGDPQSRVQSVSEMRVTTSTAICREWADFTLERLDHAQPIVLADAGITVRVSPALLAPPNTRKNSQIRIDVDSRVELDAAQLELRPRICLVRTDGSRMIYGGVGTIRHPGKSILTVHAEGRSFDAATTSLVLSIPISVEMVSSELAFHKVPVVKRQGP
ncbi:MAG: tetratricopeptide repeat protein [Sedimentisphaerales bacterium]|nr:tetratricopeptide repeat protein [Sedimentisphaerales bacterium]